MRSRLLRMGRGEPGRKRGWQRRREPNMTVMIGVVFRCGHRSCAIPDAHRARHAIDGDGVVDVVEDRIAGRRRDVKGWMAPHRERHEHRDRQHECLKGRKRRRQHNELGRWRRQEIDRQRRRRKKLCHVEYQRRAFDVDLLVQRRRGHVVINRHK